MEFIVTFLNNFCDLPEESDMIPIPEKVQRGISEIDEEYLFDREEDNTEFAVTNDSDSDVSGDSLSKLFEIPATATFAVNLEDNNESLGGLFSDEFQFDDSLFTVTVKTLPVAVEPMTPKKVAKKPKGPKPPKVISHAARRSPEASIIHFCDSFDKGYRAFVDSIKKSIKETSRDIRAANDDSARIQITGIESLEFQHIQSLKKSLPCLECDQHEFSSYKDAIDAIDASVAVTAVDLENAYEAIGLFGGICGLKEIHHYYIHPPENADGHTAKTIKMIMKELMNVLGPSLAADARGGSIFVRYDEECPQYIRALISGVQGSPYESGLFQFDIFVPSEYPNVPCLVTHVTPGANTIHAPHGPGGFSPNMHSDSGKVCLSLLGTWDGLGWEPGVSNLYQVLSSISLMILGAEYAYYMEPGHGGWEDTANIDKDKNRVTVLTYNDEIRVALIRLCMIQFMKYPPKGFEAVVKTHFVMKRRSILMLGVRWLHDFCSLSTCARCPSACYRTCSHQRLTDAVSDLFQAYQDQFPSPDAWKQDIASFLDGLKSIRYQVAFIECKLDVCCLDESVYGLHHEDYHCIEKEAHNEDFSLRSQLLAAKRGGEKLLAFALDYLCRLKLIVHENNSLTATDTTPVIEENVLETNPVQNISWDALPFLDDIEIATES